MKVINAAYRTPEEIVKDAFDKALIVAREKAKPRLKYNKRVANKKNLRKVKKKEFWQGVVIATIVMLVLHFLWILKGGC